MANTHLVMRLVAVASIAAAVFCLTQGATADVADYPIRVSGQWWGAKGTTGSLSARLALDGDTLSGFASAPGNPDLDGLALSGSAAEHQLSLEATVRGVGRGTIAGQVYGDALFGTYTTASGESGSWMGSWSADPPRIAEQWPDGSELLQPQDVPSEPARPSTLAAQALEQARGDFTSAAASGTSSEPSAATKSGSEMHLPPSLRAPRGGKDARYTRRSPWARMSWSTTSTTTTTRRTPPR